MLHAMIMAGGGGTRFWPRSRQKRPKQFLTLGGDRTLLQQALRPHRGAGAARAHLGHHRRGLPSRRPPSNCRSCRPTASSASRAAATPRRASAWAPPSSPAATPTRVMLVMPADHVIEPVQEFRRAVHVAEQMAEEHPAALVTFGIPPTFPSTGYGYIHRGRGRRHRQGVSVYRVAGVPGEAGRRHWPSDSSPRGEYFWNSGIFVWKAATILAASAPNGSRSLHAAVQRIADALGHAAARRACCDRNTRRWTKISIDYAVMEQAHGGAGRAGPVPLGRRRQLAGPGADAPAGRRRQHRPGHALRAGDASHASSSATPAS